MVRTCGTRCTTVAASRLHSAVAAGAAVAGTDCMHSPHQRVGMGNPPRTLRQLLQLQSPRHRGQSQPGTASTSSTRSPYRFSRQAGHHHRVHLPHLAFSSAVFWRHCARQGSVRAQGSERRPGHTLGPAARLFQASRRVLEGASALLGSGGRNTGFGSEAVLCKQAAALRGLGPSVEAAPGGMWFHCRCRICGHPATGCWHGGEVLGRTGTRAGVNPPMQPSGQSAPVTWHRWRQAVRGRLNRCT